MPASSEPAIVTIEPIRRRPEWQRLVLDDGSSLELPALLVAQHDLRPGTPCPPALRDSLAEAASRRACLDRALRLLAARPRSTRELERRLRQAGFSAPVVEASLARCQKLGYLDDAAFAAWWASQRQGRQSARAIRGELIGKGIDRPLADEATAALDDEAVALDLARTRWPRTTGDPRQRRERLVRFLAGRGFSWEIIQPVLRRVTGDAGDDP